MLGSAACIVAYYESDKKSIDGSLDLCQQTTILVKIGQIDRTDRSARLVVLRAEAQLKERSPEHENH